MELTSAEPRSGVKLHDKTMLREEEFAILKRYKRGERNFSASRLSGSDLSGFDLSGADLSEADLTNANLNGANLSGAKVTGVKLHDKTMLREEEFAILKRYKRGERNFSASRLSGSV